MDFPYFYVNGFPILFDAIFLLMKNPNERLKEARELHFSTAREAADALGVNRQTYAGHENGADGFPSSAAVKYARRFKMSLDWLFTGKGRGPEKRSNPARPEWKDDLEASLQFALGDGASAGEISAFVTETLLGSANTRPVASPLASLRSALLAYGVSSKSFGTIIPLIDRYVINRANDDQPEQSPPDDQSQPANPRRESTPSR